MRIPPGQVEVVLSFDDKTRLLVKNRVTGVEYFHIKEQPLVYTASGKAHTENPIVFCDLDKTDLIRLIASLVDLFVDENEINYGELWKSLDLPTTLELVDIEYGVANPRPVSLVPPPDDDNHDTGVVDGD